MTTDYNLLIINSLPGGGGHRLGRIFCCYEDVYWYSHPSNGMTPWTFAENDDVKESQHSRFHFDRIITNDVRLPLIGSRIEKYWDDRGWILNWHRIMARLSIPDGWLTYVVHDSPSYLRAIFPKSVIVNLLTDPEDATRHHMETSANFRINYRLLGQTPAWQSKWVKWRDSMLTINPGATEIDLWRHVNGGTVSDYHDAILANNQKADALNRAENGDADITVTWDTFEPESHVSKFGEINVNYKRLMKTVTT